MTADASDDDERPTHRDPDPQDCDPDRRPDDDRHDSQDPDHRQASEASEASDDDSRDPTDRQDRKEHQDELQALLATFAARAGDPPEHGLEGVAALRRRRARHRRGAVATAVTLAALLLVTFTWLPHHEDDPDDVASVAQPGRAAPPGSSQLPDVVELRCTPAGIEVPVATIRPRSDGLHLVVDNQLGRATEVWVTSESWDSGRILVEPGHDDLHQPVPPGVLTVGCRVGDRDEQRQVDLVDVEGIYDAPELSCPEPEQRRLTEDLPVDPPTWSLTAAARTALADHIDEEDDVRAPGGYPDERLSGYHTADPTARVVREGRTVAFVHLAAGDATDDAPGAGAARFPAGGGSHEDLPSPRSPTELWTHAPLVEACASFLAEEAADAEHGPVADASVTSAN
jgi:hypothetical protein